VTTRGFVGRRPADETARRLPPGQYLEQEFPVLSLGPTPRIDMATWRFTINDGPRPLASWSWDEFERLPRTHVQKDIHCVTKWSKFDTQWEGVTIDDLFTAAGIITPPTPYLLAQSYDGYDTNVPVADLVGGKGMIATRYAGEPIEAEHGGPARLLVPHLYFWKSAKWVKALRFTARDEAGFWELRGYHMYGDPWREQRYTNDP
jgi:DMSO/TMAO reductase YedYZ molybdopterin-dependent catalytic subunit